MKRMMMLGALAFVAMSVGCSAYDTPGAEYVQADRKTYNAVAPRLTKYIDADTSLEGWQKDNAKATLTSWNARVTEAEKAIAAATSDSKTGSK
jgi:hypothetical protein